LSNRFHIQCNQSYSLIGIIFILFFFSETLSAQNPASFQITTEDGLPSNEVYSILIDEEGFLWAGTDAGICKYDGVNFISYSSPAQRTKSLSGLCASPDGRIYCYSFNGQIFYAENDSLYELKNWKKKTTNLTYDASGLLWIATWDGLYSYDQGSDKFAGPFFPENSKDPIACGISAKKDTIFSLFESGLSGISKGEFYHYPLDQPLDKLSGLYVVEQSSDLPWIISVQDEQVYRPMVTHYEIVKSPELTSALKNKKVNNIRNFDDQRIWICTYDGLVIYDFVNDRAEILFEGFVLSDVLFDHEGNCWLSSLHQGLIRVPQLNTPVWNFSLNREQNDTPIKLIKNKQVLYFISTLGNFGTFDLQKSELNLFSTSLNADIQSVYFDSIDQVLYLYTNNHLHVFSNNKLEQLELVFPPVKDLIRVPQGFVLATSAGTYFYKDLLNEQQVQVLDNFWSRDLAFENKSKTLFSATNQGLLTFQFDSGQWVKTNHFLDSIQIISIAKSSDNFPVYALTFEGIIYQIDSAFSLNAVTQVPKRVIPNDLLVSGGMLCVGTNSGLFKYELITGKWTSLSRYSGLASDDVRAIVEDGEQLWLATGKGLQAIPRDLSEKRKTGKIYLKTLYRDEDKIDPTNDLILNYDQSLSFILEAAHYTSNEKFRYAYRLPMMDSSWNIVPATSKKISIPSIPPGEFTVEIKFTDYLGNDSENIILLRGIVIPPFWQRWWFYMLIGLIGVLLAFLLSRYRIAKLKSKQIAELHKMRLENELRLSQQIALKAQMNPHFIFNVLNSIKGYIYENDKKKAAAYLSDFSDLVRRILTMSAQPNVRLSEELETLAAYIRLEQMMLDGEFIYEEKVSDEVDSAGIRIPVLLIQPFVENAFQHGLRHKSGEKKLSLHVYYEATQSILVIEIIDNGIGRKKSSELNSITRQNHKSFAVESSSKRIELINREKSGLVGVEIQDLVDETANGIGTRVIIKIHVDD
jgi:ligand-binding sensor domain-containing protein